MYFWSVGLKRPVDSNAFNCAQVINHFSLDGMFVNAMAVADKVTGSIMSTIPMSLAHPMELVFLQY